jgi:hypothetical protein
MLRSVNGIPKLVTALAVVGLIMGLSALRASAAPATPSVGSNDQVTSFTNANWSGRYACQDTSDDDFFTAVMKLNPNGAGAFDGGTLSGSADAFGVEAPIASADFCLYNLDLPDSSYSITANGTGFAEMTWVPPFPVTNDPLCPLAFENQYAVNLRGNVEPGTLNVLRAELASANLFDEDEPGHGYCLF